MGNMSYHIVSYVIGGHLHLKLSTDEISFTTKSGSKKFLKRNFRKKVHRLIEKNEKLGDILQKNSMF